MDISDSDLLSRAIGAESRYCKRNGYLFQAPSHSRSLDTIERTVEGARIELRNGGELLARYRWNGSRVTRLADQGRA